MPRRRQVVLVALATLLVAGVSAAYTPDRPRAALEARYLASGGDMRLVDGTRLHVRDTGPRDAPAIVLLHGLGASLHTWDAWAARLDSSFRVVRLDLPGHGLSGPDVTGDYRDTRTHRLLAALLDTLGIARATVVGNSIGGRIAWSFAAAQPSRVERLVLVAPDGFASPGFEYDRAPEVPATFKLLRVALPKWTIRMQLAPAYGDASRLDEATLTRYHDLLLAPGNRAALLERLSQTVLTDPRARLRTIAAPVLLVWGSEDRLIPPRNAADYLAVLPRARRVVLQGLGHVPFEEAPDAALAAVRPFLDSLRVPASAVTPDRR